MTYLYIGIAVLVTVVYLIREPDSGDFRESCQKLAFDLALPGKLALLEGLLDRILAEPPDVEAMERFERTFAGRAGTYLPTTQLVDRYTEANRVVSTEREFAPRVASLASIREKYLAAEEFVDQVHLLKQFISEFRLVPDTLKERIVEAVGMTDDEAVGTLSRLLSDRFQMRLAAFSQDPGETTLLQLEEYFVWQRKPFDKATPAGLTLPERPNNWNDWVAEHIEVPATGQFIGELTRSRSSSEFALMAAVALEEGDIVAVKYCRAMYHDNQRLHDHMSSQRADHLADFVATYHAQRTAAASDH